LPLDRFGLAKRQECQSLNRVGESGLHPFIMAQMERSRSPRCGRFCLTSISDSRYTKNILEEICFEFLEQAAEELRPPRCSEDARGIYCHTHGSAAISGLG